MYHVMTEKGWRPLAGILSCLTPIGDSYCRNHYINFGNETIKITKHQGKFMKPIQQEIAKDSSQFTLGIKE